jgi:serine protease Do
MQAVVGVLTTQAAESQPSDPARDLIDQFHAGVPRKGLGTGFIIHPDGWILTNAHVVDRAAKVEVDIGEDGEDERRYSARVVGTDEATDVALLKVDAAEPLPSLPLGDSDEVSVAEWVMVIGNPFGLSRSVTHGIVSHTGRSDVAPAGRDGYYDFIQTDASINPGNSGGPLVDLRGEVIGIATAINASGQGIGFAIPINMAKIVLGQLREHGHVIRSWMGLSVQEMPTDPWDHGSRPHGIVVTYVVAGGPADRGGIKIGDVITRFEGQEVRSPARLRWYVATAGVGRSVALTVRRGQGAEQALRVKLGEQPAPEEPEQLGDLPEAARQLPENPSEN